MEEKRNHLPQEKQKVLRVAKKAYEEKLMAGTSGNMSLFCPGTQQVVITPSSYDYGIMEEEDIVVIDLDGNVLEGRHKPSSEWRMHAAVYEAKPEAGAIIHTHSPYATAFAVNNKGIPTILIEMVPFLGGDVPLAKFAIPGTRGVGDEAVKVLANRTGCLLANHGVLTIGASLEQAHLRAVYIEDAAKICSIAMSNGPIVTMTEADIAAMKHH